RPENRRQKLAMKPKAFSKSQLQDLYIFQGNLPGPLAAHQAAVLGTKGPPRNPFTFSLKGQPALETPGGTVQIADSSNFHMSKTIASALVTLRPGALRELHWHPT